MSKKLPNIDIFLISSLDPSLKVYLGLPLVLHLEFELGFVRPSAYLRIFYECISHPYSSYQEVEDQKCQY